MYPTGELVDSVLEDANSSEKSCDQMQHNPFHSAEMQMNTGGGNLTLHHSDLHSKINVSSAEMQKDSGHGHDTLHYSDLYSHKSVNSAEIPTKTGHGHIALHHSHLYSNENVPPVEMQMDRGRGDICYPEQGDEFVDPAAEYSESSSENEGSSSRKYSVCDMHEKLSEYNEDQPEDLLSVGRKHIHSSCFTSVQDNNRKASSRNQSQGPIVLLGCSSYFVSLYKHVYTLTALAEKYHYDLSFIEDEVQAVKWWDILDKHKLEYMKSELEIMLGDNNVESDLPSDLTDTDEEGSSGKDGNETDGNSSSSSIREVLYDTNACEKYIKPAKEHNLPPILGMFTNTPNLQRLPKCSSPSGSVLQNVPKGMVVKSKFASHMSSIGTYDKEHSSLMQMSQTCHHEASSAAGLSQRQPFPSTATFGSPASFQQRCGVVTTTETIQKLASSATWKFNPPPSGAP